MRITVCVGVIALLVAGGAAAQDKKVDVNAGGGFTFTAGEVENHLGNGGNFDLGVTFMATPKLGFQAQYGYTGLRGKDFQLPVASTPGGATVNQQFSANMHMHGGSFDVLIKPEPDAKASPYVLAGPGVYHRSVTLTTPSVGFVTICDPFWFICYPAAVPVNQVVGARSSTDFGLNFGGGVDFKVSEHASVYVEIRYLYVWGPEVSPTAVPLTGAPATTKANGQFLPITGGIRW